MTEIRAPSTPGDLATRPRRIAVIGISGAGKSVFARELAARTGLPLIPMDGLFWRGAWEAVPEAEYLQAHAALLAGDRWIIEGYVDSAMAARLHAADLVIYLDYPGPLCAWRVLKRRLQHHRRARPELPAQARERLSLGFLATVITRAERPSIEKALQGVDPAKVRRVQSPAALALSPSPPRPGTAYR